VIFRRPQPARPPAAHSSPMTDQQLLELAARNEAKRLEAIAFLGRRWLLHPVNRIR
jgi:hypothetical protein